MNHIQTPAPLKGWASSLSTIVLLEFCLRFLVFVLCEMMAARRPETLKP